MVIGNKRVGLSSPLFSTHQHAVSVGFARWTAPADAHGVSLMRLSNSSALPWPLSGTSEAGKTKRQKKRKASCSQPFCTCLCEVLKSSHTFLHFNPQSLISKTSKSYIQFRKKKSTQEFSCLCEQFSLLTFYHRLVKNGRVGLHN